MYVAGAISEEHIPLALATHQGKTLTGECLLDELGGAAALEGEVDVALVGHHRALARHEGITESDPQHPRVLVGDRFRLLLAEPAVDQFAGDTRESVTGDLGRTAARYLRRVGRAGWSRGWCLRRCGTQWCPKHLALRRNLIGPTAAVPPPVFVTALGIGLPLTTHRELLVLHVAGFSTGQRRRPGGRTPGLIVADRARNRHPGRHGR